MSRPMTIHELNTLLLYVKTNNSPGQGLANGVTLMRAGRPCIKYVDPVIDMRDGMVFAVKFRGFGCADQSFTVTNESRDLPDSLYDRIMAYLNGSASK